MAKKRPPNWQRGAPRLSQPEASTAGTDFFQSHSVQGTLEGTPDAGPNDYVPLPEGPRPWRFPISGGMLSAIITAVGILGAAILYVANLRADIAVANSEIRAVQKSQEIWTSTMREQIKRLEEGVERRLADIDAVLRRPSPKAGAKEQR